MHCCSFMRDFTPDYRIQINYEPILREYSIPLLYKGKITALQRIFYCPWCGTILPKSLNDEWFAILEKEYGLNDPDSNEQKNMIPEEFKTDEWWKKRRL